VCECGLVLLLCGSSATWRLSSARRAGRVADVGASKWGVGEFGEAGRVGRGACVERNRVVPESKQVVLRNEKG